MPVHHLSLRGFRSYRDLEVDFPGGPQVVVGRNAAGKTNLLEAMVVLSQGSSHRTTADQELITWGEPMARLDATVSTGRIEVVLLAAGSMPGARKRVKVNGVSRRTSALSGALRAVVFAPEDMQLVVGSPSLRRLSLDTLVVQHIAAAAAAMSTYARALTQRNNLLRRIREEAASRDELPYWDGVVVAEGGRIVRWRTETLAALAVPLADAHAEIAPGEGALTIRSVSNAMPALGESPEDALRRRLAETADKEVWNGATLVGPASGRRGVRPGRPGAVGVRVARTAADRDPGPQARPARPADAGRWASAPAAPGRRLLRAGSRSDVVISYGASAACPRRS